MADPRGTPRQNRDNPLNIGTPSPRKIQEWNNGYVQASPHHSHQRDQIVKLIYQLLGDQTEPIQTREATAFMWSDAIQSAMQQNNLEFEFTEELATVFNAVQLDDGATRDNADAMVQELHQVLGHHGVTAEEVADHAAGGQENWMQALVDEGLAQGDGSEESPFYTGAHDLQEAPQAIEVTIGASAGIHTDRIKEIQGALFVAFRDMIFQGTRDRRRLWMKLHPWAVVNWVNFFTGLLLGSKGIAKINAVLAAAGNRNVYGETQLDIQRAQMLSRNLKISAGERKLFSTVAHAMQSDTAKSNAYTKFVNNCACALLTRKFEQMVDEVKDNPTGEVSRSLSKQGATGNSARDRVLHTCATNMYWEVDQFLQLLDRQAALSSCALAFTGGFLILVDDKMKHIVKNNTRSALPFLINIVRREFPELKSICGQLFENLCLPLMNPDPQVSGRVAGKQIDSRTGELDMVGRVTAAIE